ncbi:MAG TPA: gas vesicle protein GvpJ [Longimicrobiales bacterium]
MAVERAAAGSSLIDVLDRVLDKGIVIDAYVRVSLVGIDLVSVEARIVVASVETYLRFAEAIALTGTSSRPVIAPPNTSEMDRIMAENAELRRKLDELS